MDKPEHTPLPWIIPDGIPLAYGYDIYSGVPYSAFNPWVAFTNMTGGKSRRQCKADADFIVRACNSHYELLEACRYVALHLEGDQPDDYYQAMRNRLRYALDKAKGNK